MLVQEPTAAAVRSISKKDFNVAPRISTAPSATRKKSNLFLRNRQFRHYRRLNRIEGALIGVHLNPY
jgi:hypothetical protein